MAVGTGFNLKPISWLTKQVGSMSQHGIQERVTCLPLCPAPEEELCDLSVDLHCPAQELYSCGYLNFN